MSAKLLLVCYKQNSINYINCVQTLSFYALLMLDFNDLDLFCHNAIFSVPVLP